MAENLTRMEKTRLLVEVDRRKRDDYDKDFYDKLRKIEEPNVEEVDDRIRRALIRYIQEVESHFLGEHNPPGSYLMEGWILGYVAATNIERSIFKKNQRSEAER